MNTREIAGYASKYPHGISTGQIEQLAKDYLEAMKLLNEVYSEGCNCIIKKRHIVECVSCKAHRLIIRQDWLSSETKEGV